MNTEILLSLEIIFFYGERKAQKKTETKKKTQNHGYKTKKLKHNKKNNNNKFISVLLIVNYVNFFMITLQSYCWLFASRLMIAIWCTRGRVINSKNIKTNLPEHAEISLNSRKNCL